MEAQQVASTVIAWMPTIVISVLAVLAVTVLVKFLRAVGSVLTALGQAGKVLGLLGKGLWWLTATAVKLVSLAGRLWRSTATLAVLGIWLAVWGLTPGLILLITLLVLAVVVAVTWQILDPENFDVYCGHRLRSWWMRWGYYGLRWNTWVRNLALSVRQAEGVNGAHESAPAGSAAMVTLDTPRILAVSSGPAWDSVKVRLAIGQTIEEFTDKTEALATARRSQRCVVRELDPGFVALDFERHDPLAETVPAPFLADVPGESVDLRKAAIGMSEYGRPWLLPVLGSHTLTAGVTGAGKNSVTWSLLRALAPAIRDGLVRVRGIDPKVLEMEFAKDLLHRYATEPKDAADLVAEYIADMNARKHEVRGTTRKVQPSTEHPLELLMIDELGALTKYLGDRQTREKITQLLGLGLSQGRGLAFSIAAFVQDPTKDTVPMRDLFPTRVCLRTQTESQTEMVLGEGAVERGALSHRIPDEDAEGVGYVLGEKRRRPVRVRAGWVDDPGVEELRAFCTPNGPLTGVIAPPPAELDERRSRRGRDAA